MNTLEHEEKIYKGLAGVVVDVTAISKVIPEKSVLIYRGYPVDQLAQQCSFEEVAYLLWHGELPTQSQLSAFVQQEQSQRRLESGLEELLINLPAQAHPMDITRTAISYLGTVQTTESSPMDTAIKMFAILPTIVATAMRHRHGQHPIAPDPSLGYVDNFFHMCFGQLPTPTVRSAFEQSMILYAEHSFNASTFAARVVTSTQSDIYSAVTAAIGALKGPLHGGANEAVMHDMLEIGDPNRAAEWIQHKLAAKEKIMGFGHRVYKLGDSRVPTMYQALVQVAQECDGQRWLEIYQILEKEMFEATKIKPNLDFPTGPAYYLMGFDIPMFTPLFVMSRIVGWTAHIMEQAAANALIRPLSAYVGHPHRDVAR